MMTIPSISELYEKILERTPPALPGFEASVNAAAVRRAGRIHDYLKFRADRKAAQQRARWIGFEILRPLSQHSDIIVVPHYEKCYEADKDTFHVDVGMRPQVNWAKTAYRFAKQPGMKYDREGNVYGIDGQPRCSSDGYLWVRYVGDFLDGSKATFHIISREPSHRDAEQQLEHFYALFKEKDGQEPDEVFKKYW